MFGGALCGWLEREIRARDPDAQPYDDHKSYTRICENEVFDYLTQRIGNYLRQFIQIRNNCRCRILSKNKTERNHTGRNT